MPFAVGMSETRRGTTRSGGWRKVDPINGCSGWKYWVFHRRRGPRHRNYCSATALL